MEKNRKQGCEIGEEWTMAGNGDQARPPVLEASDCKTRSDQPGMMTKESRDKRMKTKSRENTHDKTFLA